MVLNVKVFKPLKLKSSPGRSVIGRGKAKRACPLVAKAESFGPPG